MIRRPGIVAGAVLTAAALASCSTSADVAVDAGVPLSDLSNARVLDMPPGFADVATGCDGTTGVYVSAKVGYAGAAVMAVVDDPSCVSGIPIGSGLGNGGQESGAPSVDLEGAVTG